MRPARSVSVAALMVLLAACATNPVTGRRELALASEAEEIEMGRQGAAAVTASIGLVQNASLQTYVNGIGQSLARRTERPGLPWEFHVVDDASINAFALPGGFIFVTRGLLAHLTTEAELASVLGHENGHVAARHSVQQMSRQQVAALGLGVGSVLVPAVAQYGQLAGAGVGVLFLKYGRDDETQSDQLGFRYALAEGYDTREMINVFQMLQRAEQLSGVGKLPAWQSTHPDPGSRISSIQSMVAAASPEWNTRRIGGDEFLQQIDGMVFGVNPRAGFFRGSVFMHPDLQFVMQFPADWETRNAADVVAGISGHQDAMIELRGVKGSASEAARDFVAQQGLSAGTQSRRVIHGNQAVSAEFMAQSGQGVSVQGIAAFIEYRGATWGIVTYAVATRFAQYRNQFLATINSFDRLTDASALAVQPMRLRIEKAPRAMSLQQFNAILPSAVPLEQLALINGLDPAAQLRAGQSIKRVIGTATTPVGGRQ